VIGRRSCGYQHAKLKEILHNDFFNISELKETLQAYDTCLFCLGVSSVGMKEADFRHMTYDLTMHFAEQCAHEGMSFSYISGAGTDSTEKGRLMWARVKGKTENDLQKLPFKKVYLYRPGMLKPTPGLKHTLKYYKYLGWLYPVLKVIAPNTASTLSQLGQSMIRTAYYQYPGSIIEVKDIIKTAQLNA
jgi:hypothetical protein